MKIRLAILTMVASLLLCSNSAYSTEKMQDTTKNANNYIEKLNGFILDYLKQTPPIPDSLSKASDILINLSKDTIVRSYVARYLFDLFNSSSIMGMEAPAIHIATNYILNGKIKGLSQEALMMINLFVEFNKSSLIGMDAPELEMSDTSGKKVSLRGIKSNYTIVYFYDDQCKVCKADMPYFKKALLNNLDLGLSVFAVYTQPSEKKAKAYIKENFSDLNNSGINFYFVSDSLLESDFQRKYAVLATPQVFLLDENKKIVGRNLKGESLSQLLSSLKNRSDKSVVELVDFFDNYFEEYNLSDSTERKAAFGLLFEKSKSSPKLYRDIFGELYLYLRFNSEPSVQSSMPFMVKNYIEPFKNLWEADLKIYNDIIYSASLAMRNPVGEKTSDLKLFTSENMAMRLSEINADNTILMFFDIKCKICEVYLKDITRIIEMSQNRDLKVVLVYTGRDKTGFIKYCTQGNPHYIWLHDTDRESEMFDKYDLSSVPTIYLLDKDKKIIAKDINTITLEKLLK